MAVELAMPRRATGYIECRIVGGKRHHWIRVRLPDGSRPRFLLGVGLSDAYAREKAAAWNERRQEILAEYAADVRAVASDTAPDFAALVRDRAERRTMRRRAMAHANPKRIEALPECSGVYFVQQDTGGPIKIGRATNIKERVAALQTANPFRLALLAFDPGTGEAEPMYHRTFARARLAGSEWFLPVPELLACIDALRASCRRTSEAA